MRALFISDLHLAPERPRANEQFVAFLEGPARDAQTLYILGDLFEYWIGDDVLDEPFNAVMTGMLRRLTAGGVQLYVMHGNRDFLMGSRFCAAAGAAPLVDPSVHEIGGQRTLLTHGDTLCTDDHDYQAWRRISRSPQWQRELLARPLEERRAMVLGLREKSRAVTQEKADAIMDVNPGAVVQALHEHGAQRLIHGHTHRPGRHALEVDAHCCERWVLPDWYEAGGYLEIAGDSIRLVRLQ